MFDVFGAAFQGKMDLWKRIVRNRQMLVSTKIYFIVALTCIVYFESRKLRKNASRAVCDRRFDRRLRHVFVGIWVNTTEIVSCKAFHGISTSIQCDMDSISRVGWCRNDMTSWKKASSSRIGSTLGSFWAWR